MIPSRTTEDLQFILAVIGFITIMYKIFGK